MHLIQQASAAPPDTALLLLAIGAIALTIEFLRPGLVLPGVCGSILAFLGLVALSRVSWSALQLLLIAGAVLVILNDVRFIYRLAACASFLAGLLLHPRLHLIPVLFAGTVLWALTGILLPLARRARRNKTEVASNVMSIPLS